VGNKNQTLLIALALFFTYFIWGSTHLAIRFGLESFPPFLMGAVRFTVAGTLFYGALRAYGAPRPNWQEWRGASIVGVLAPALGNGTVCYVQQTVSSGVAALSIATAAIWMAIFSSFFGHKITKQEWLGIVVGFVGIVLLSTRGSLQGDWLSALLLTFAAASWAFGSTWGKYLKQPAGLMAPAVQMLAGGVALMIASALFGETWPAQVSVKSWGAMVFLIVLGTWVTYTAFQYLLKTVRPLVATSNTFVNPIVAFAVGIWLADETIHRMEYIALAVILTGVLLILLAENKEKT
jgi:drug/metabolite transporter (DMT)-like permease